MNIFEIAFSRKRSSFENEKTSNSIFYGNKGKDDSEKFFILAETSYLHNDLSNALQMINQSIEMGGNSNWKNFAFKANCLEDLQVYNDAIKNYEKAIELNGNDADVYALYHQIGFCYLTIGNNEKAEEFYTYAIDLKQEFQKTGKEDLEGLDGGVLIGIPFNRMYNNRANARKNQNKLNEAFEDCKKSISFDQDYSNPYLLLSQIFSKAGQEQEAIKYLRISAQLGNPNAIRMLNQLNR